LLVVYIIQLEVKVNQDGLKLNGIHQVLVQADDLNSRILEGNVHMIEQNTEYLVFASTGIGLTVNAEKTQNMVTSRDQSAGRSHSIETDYIPFETVEEFKYLGTTLTNQNSIHEEIMSRLKSGNACYLSVQNISSSVILSKI
jgi:hypothetical protein